MVDILTGDCREILPTLPAASVHCCITSPPYWGLRDYGVAGQVGLEESVEGYVAELVEIFWEVRRVLREDGTLWLNLGDCYARNAAKGGAGELSGPHGYRRDGPGGRVPRPQPLPEKNLIGLPWRVAFALQADGWILRSDIIWAKPNAMPESVRDRPTRSHEYLFLFAKSPRYYYDREAVREEAVCRHPSGNGYRRPQQRTRGGRGAEAPWEPTAHRSRRSVWTLNTQPFKGAHFAVFPEALVEPCLLAATSAEGACVECGAPRQRDIQKGDGPPEPEHRAPAKRLAPGQAGNVGAGNMGFRASRLSGQEMNRWKADHPDETVGWEPTCDCGTSEVVPGTVLDPFFGAGTVGVVAQRHGRRALGIELNPAYCDLARARLAEAT